MTELEIPQGRLLRSRVVSDTRTLLVDALDRSLTGYAIVFPQRADAGNSVFAFEAGVPVFVYHSGRGVGGERALAFLSDVGPCRTDLYALTETQLRSVHDGELSVDPALPATSLTGDRALAKRTRKRATAAKDAASADEQSTNSVAAFLDDTERIETLREHARAEARRRAHEWGLDEQLASNEE